MLKLLKLLLGAAFLIHLGFKPSCNMASIKIYTTLVCPYCTQAKQLLQSLDAEYEEIRIDINEDQRAEMERLSGRRTVPQIFIDGKAIGGFTDLQSLHTSGELKNMLC